MNESYTTFAACDLATAYKGYLTDCLAAEIELKERRLHRLTTIPCIKDDGWFKKWRPMTLDEALERWNEGESTDVGDHGGFSPRSYDYELIDTLSNVRYAKRMIERYEALGDKQVMFKLSAYDRIRTHLDPKSEE